MFVLGGSILQKGRWCRQCRGMECVVSYSHWDRRFTDNDPLAALHGLTSAATNRGPSTAAICGRVRDNTRLDAQPVQGKTSRPRETQSGETDSGDRLAGPLRSVFDCSEHLLDFRRLQFLERLGFDLSD